MHQRINDRQGAQSQLARTQPLDMNAGISRQVNQSKMQSQQPSATNDYLNGMINNSRDFS